jgi:hypothetical protein
MGAWCYSASNPSFEFIYLDAMNKRELNLVVLCPDLSKNRSPARCGDQMYCVDERVNIWMCSESESVAQGLLEIITTNNTVLVVVEGGDEQTVNVGVGPFGSAVDINSTGIAALVMMC